MAVDGVDMIAVIRAVAVRDIGRIDVTTGTDVTMVGGTKNVLPNIRIKSLGKGI